MVPGTNIIKKKGTEEEKGKSLSLLQCPWDMLVKQLALNQFNLTFKGENDVY